MSEEITENKNRSDLPSGAVHSELQGSKPSYWPIILSIGTTLVAIGMVSRIAITGVGVVVMLVALVGWAWQPWGE